MSAALAAPSGSSTTTERIEVEFLYLDVLDAMLREVYGGQARPVVAPAPSVAVSDNSARFFGEKAPTPAAKAASCCAPAEQVSCCEPAAKASCCGNVSSGSCGCR